MIVKLKTSTIGICLALLLMGQYAILHSPSDRAYSQDMIDLDDRTSSEMRTMLDRFATDRSALHFWEKSSCSLSTIC